MTGWLAVLTASAAVGLALPVRSRLPRALPVARRGAEDPGWMIRLRAAWSLLAAAGAATFVGGSVGPAVGVAAGLGAWVFIGRAEPAEVRRHREAVQRDLPHVVNLLATALRSGAAPGEAVTLVCGALPGVAADRLAGVAARLSLGVDPVRVWESLGHDRELARLGRTMARAQATGAPVVAAVERLGWELARNARAEIEDRARAVGVKAALPLGLCLLPAFVLIGIVPLVAGLMATTLGL